TEPVAIAVALADKLDLLTGFWAIDEKPTGSRDPFALRRAALGVIRIVVENGLRLSLAKLGAAARYNLKEAVPYDMGSTPSASVRDSLDRAFNQVFPPELAEFIFEEGLASFFHDRLKVTLREQGARHDLVDAVISQDSDDMLQITRRVAALSALLDSEDGQNLLAGYRRGVNILGIEEKKDGRSYGQPVDQ